MASRRIGQSSINWSALAEKVPAEQKHNLQAFKAKSDSYLRRVLSNPAEPPKIDWALYKRVVPVAGMVENFQKQYEALKIPYPQDTVTSQVEAQWAELKKAINEFVAASNATIAKYEKEIETTKAILPFDQMTMEDFRDAYPDQALDPINKPTYWPHTPEEQLDYVAKDELAEKH